MISFVLFHLKLHKGEAQEGPGLLHPRFSLSFFSSRKKPFWMTQLWFKSSCNKIERTFPLVSQISYQLLSH